MLKVFFLFLLLSQTYADFTTDEKDAIVEKVNCYRNYHQAPDVSWDNAVATSAQNWANYLATNNRFTHSGSNFGENLFSMSSMSLPSEQTVVIDRAIDSWYSEEENYDYSHPGFSMTTGHFTQLVWISTRKIGVGYAINQASPMKKAIVVMQYDPAGNMNTPSMFSQNVKPSFNSTPEPTPSPTPSPTPEPTPSPTPEPTPSPTPSPTPEPTPSPTPEPTPSPTPEPTPSPTPSPRPSQNYPFISIKVPFYRVRDDNFIRNTLCTSLVQTLPFSTTSCRITYRSSSGTYYGLNFNTNPPLRTLRTYLQQNRNNFTRSSHLYCDSTITIGIGKDIFYRLLASSNSCLT